MFVLFDERQDQELVFGCLDEGEPVQCGSGVEQLFFQWQVRRKPHQENEL